MESIGVIRADVDPPGVDRRRWIALIDEHPNLAVGGSHSAINPFTRLPMTVPPRADFSRVVVDGQEVGRMSCCEADANEINVFGDLQQVAAIAFSIAAILGVRW